MLPRRVLIGAAIALAISGALFIHARSHASRPLDQVEKNQPRSARAAHPHRFVPRAKKEDEARAKLGGRVTNKDGAQISGAQVCAAQDANASCSTSGADGRYTIEELAAGRWYVHASKSGYLTARAEPDGATDELDLRPGVAATADFVLLEGGALLTGMVRDSGGGVIVGASVEEDHGTRATTDVKGKFNLWLAPGPASLTVRAEGYASEVFDGTAPGEVDVVLHPESTIAGRVIAAGTGNPIAGARVTTEWSGGEVEAITERDGSFTLGGVSPGEHHLSAVAPGWMAEHSDTIVVGRADSVRDVVLEASPALSLYGSIVQLPDRTVCPRGTIEVVAPIGAIARDGEADENGHYELHGLLPATYEGTAHCESGDVGASVEVEINDEDVEMEIEVGPIAARLRGIVLGRDGKPRGNAPIALMHAETYASLAVDAGADGRFVALLPELGKWSVVGERNCPEEQPLLEVEVRVPDPPPVTISLATFGGVRGRTIDKEGKPIATELVFVPGGEKLGGCVAPTASSSGKDGRFELDLAPERWTVHSAEYGNEDETVELRTKRGAVEAIDVVAGETEEIEVVLEPHRGRIKGRVVDRDGHPVADAMVAHTKLGTDEEDAEGINALLWDDLDFEYGFEVTDENGRFELENLVEGVYGVGAKARTGGCGKVAPVKLGSDVTVKLEAWASIEGVVLAPSGGPESVFTLTASSADEMKTVDVRGADGKFALRSLAGGLYELSVEAKDGEGRRRVEVRSGESARGVDIALSPRAHVFGRVVGGDGEPVVEATVQIARANDPGERIGFEPPAAVTDEQGRFDIPNAPLGDVWVTVSHDEYYIPMHEEELRSGESRELELVANKFPGYLEEPY